MSRDFPWIKERSAVCYSHVHPCLLLLWISNQIIKMPCSYTTQWPVLCCFSPTLLGTKRRYLYHPARIIPLKNSIHNGWRPTSRFKTPRSRGKPWRGEGDCSRFVFCKRVKTNSQVEKGISKGCPSNDDGATAAFQPLQTDTFSQKHHAEGNNLSPDYSVLDSEKICLMGGTEYSFLIWQLHFSSRTGVIMMFDDFQWVHNLSLKN